MCWAAKCCFCVRLDRGCLLLGMISFNISMITTVVAGTLLILERRGAAPTRDTPGHQLLEMAQIHVTKTSMEMLLWITLIVGILAMTASILLTLGILRRRAGFVLSYFAFGIFLTILLQLAALLVLLHNHWIAAIVAFTFSMCNIHFLVVVHSVYETLQRGKYFDSIPHARLDEQPILNDV